ncbi:MAG: AmmeMemoRadiSam system radical SAM enzyme [Candidatus Omnitrophota bacterium]|nr:AmmeMemoRadiSam system radical SAM enzyme [bacterium]MBU3929425.1 AmmeMemoRadiSam system radical SAM enzyme [bacterium]
MKEASFYSVLNPGKNILRCELCPRRCVIPPGKKGFCGVRQNTGGKLLALTYGKLSSVSLDPLEKKPLYNFCPGKEILSIGSVGCNFICPWCQNYGISQSAVEDAQLRDARPDELVTLAKTYNSVGIAYTYNEPLINFEFIRDCAELFNKHLLKNVLVTNGYINEKPLALLLPLMDAANIDIKFFRHEPYKKYCGGDLGDVMRSVEMFVKAGKHIELTFCVIPGLNDDEDDFREMIDWIWALSPSVPLHISRYFPAHKHKSPPTSLKTLDRLRDVAIKKLDFVYQGNVSGQTGTYCPVCRALLIQRTGYSVEIKALNGSSCANCGAELSIAL